MNYKEYKEKLKIEYNEYKEKIKNKLNEFKIKQNKQLEKFKNKQINSKKKNKRKTRGGVLYNRLDHYVFIKSFLDIVIDNKYYENPANEDNINRSMKHVLENDTLLQVFF